MTKKLMVLADLGHLKAYQIEESDRFSTPRLELLDQWASDVPNHLREEVTDQAGQYRKGSVTAGASNTSDGDEHNLDLERRRRAAKAIAKRVTHLMNRQEFDGCYFAAPGEIRNSILDELDPRNRARIEKNVAANLTRLNTSEVLAHFCG